MATKILTEKGPYNHQRSAPKINKSRQRILVQHSENRYLDFCIGSWALLRCAPAIKRFSHLASTVLGLLECSALGPPPQIPRGPASRAPRTGLLWLRDLATARFLWTMLY
ncbi:hypothetical protein PHYSODRAFT_521018 [Phytophthora sojae]|uniref:Uncharacterized protein n=1 Tax=Phytophthora sojae (strain P6497) TaxID=1094619 RepID=G5A1I6_PHYSP|nr:hypothetical protein PHYSODRAFT_521018 [Phytophthora sojae]EGZ10784.1 hypothetical protein PHYSODRAFT_521018 [Phytophthora sojae]|eukprot:XP_009533529.1 hypothetical protein PHYSODRAFT_521018 [Phytophthora sojae]